jgi:hypothetical protein
MKRLLIKLLIKVKRQAQENECKIGKLLRTLESKQYDLHASYIYKLNVIISKLGG